MLVILEVDCNARFGVASNIHNHLHLVLAFFAIPEMKNFVFAYVPHFLWGNHKPIASRARQSNWPPCGSHDEPPIAIFLVLVLASEHKGNVASPSNFVPMLLCSNWVPKPRNDAAMTRALVSARFPNPLKRSTPHHG